MNTTVLDEEHFWAALVYVEQNPVRANLVAHAADWRWSSARVHLGLAPASFLNLVRWRQRFDASDWEHCLSRGLAEGSLMQRIRETTRSGFPLGPQEFCQDLERKLGVQTLPGKRGRPRKAQQIEGFTPTLAVSVAEK